MKFSLNSLNFLGVVVLAGLSAWQWTDNIKLHNECLSLKRIQREQSERLAEQKQTLDAQATDLRQLQEKTTLLVDERDAAQGESERLTSENGQLTVNVDQWKQAVAGRDAQIEKARTQIAALTAARDEAIGKFNKLAEQVNAANKRR